MQPVQCFVRSPITAPERVRPAVREDMMSSSAALGSVLGERSRTFLDDEVTLGRPSKSVGEHLFDALAEAKIWTSKVAMHLDLATRDRLFRQLDVLHEAEEWPATDQPITLDSYKSLVRAILYHKINSRPGLSLMPEGNIIAVWNDGDDRLTIEFLPANRARWLVVNATPKGAERTAGTTPLERLRDVLAPYGAERWFDGG
ncbi:MAG: hypothetical protein E7773_00690 [Sphingomonas sp.]|uniref:hypothetical protein n=1 Tax=Sphingomonas sp. TaxID=28214 RepID=UPI00122BB854|nr:hypothetical protein [Sphingomonas sp.]THD38304.1 MAG: hypothetical protein E7773_00690 [Sphingomonas sp.]